MPDDEKSKTSIMVVRCDLFGLYHQLLILGIILRKVPYIFQIAFNKTWLFVRRLYVGCGDEMYIAPSWRELHAYFL